VLWRVKTSISESRSYELKSTYLGYGPFSPTGEHRQAKVVFFVVVFLMVLRIEFRG
jgi:hypothetical protein